MLSSFPAVRMVLLYGVTDPKEIIFRDYIDTQCGQNPGRFKAVYVNSGPSGEAWEGETGFITREVIGRHIEAPENCTFFLCGPPEMYSHLDTELASFTLRPGRIRKEAPGDTFAAVRFPDFPREQKGKRFTLKIHTAAGTRDIPASSEESVLCALERAGIAAPSECRSGECGFCRSRLISGEIYVIKSSDGRRQADRKFGYFHPCASYPLSDMEISVPQNPVRGRL